jgi:hypothetical protein
LEKIIDTAKQNNWINTKIDLPHGVDFIDEVYNSFYLNMDYSKFYDKKLLVGGLYGYLDVTNINGDYRRVSTLREWQQSELDGFLPMNNAAIKMSSSFTYLEELINALEKAKMPRISFIREPWLGLNNIDYLSPNILAFFPEELKKLTSEGNSIGDLVRKGILKVNESSYNSISVEFEEMETSLVEQFRADFNDDGTESIFTKGWLRAVRGSMGVGFSTILSRYSNNHLIEEVNLKK